MLNMTEMMRDVHENAKAHGWWDGERTMRGVRALIVSEWSEALEEAREGRPMVWHACRDAGRKNEIVMCEAEKDCPCKADAYEQDCAAYGEKPEGIAVELIDGCIRILDYLGFREYDANMLPETMEGVVRRGRMLFEHDNIIDISDPLVQEPYTEEDMPVDVLVDYLTETTMKSTGGYGLQAFVQAMCIACAWVEAHGHDPELLMRQKHRYNQKRPYKHGKKF